MFPSSCGSVSRFSPPDKPHLSLSLSLSPAFSLPPHQTFLLFFLPLVLSPTRLILTRPPQMHRPRPSVQLASAFFTRPYPLLLWTLLLIASQHANILGLPQYTGPLATTVQGWAKEWDLGCVNPGGRVHAPLGPLFCPAPFLEIIEHIARIKRISAATGTLDS